MSEGPHPIATSSQTVGPFFHFGLTANESLGRIASPDTPGEHIQLRVRVLDGAGEAVPDAVIEIYQADAEGRYPDSTEPPAASSEPRVPSPEPRRRGIFSGFGRLPTGADGSCQFQTIKPGVVRTNGPNPLSVPMTANAASVSNEATAARRPSRNATQSNTGRQSSSRGNARSSIGAR